MSLHNAARAQHGASQLSWSPTLAAAAQQVADKCIFAHSALPYGENIGLYGAGGDPAAIFKVWYNEQSAYSFAAPGFGENTGHFTQVVWKGTSQLGCAVSVCAAGIPVPGWNHQGAASLLVCEYDPPGNMLPATNWIYNVLPLQS